MQYKSVAFVNIKGGCGKSTGTIHVAGVLAAKNPNPEKKVALIVEFDRQMNSSDILLADNDDETRYNMLDYMRKERSLEECAKKAYFRKTKNGKPQYYGIDVIPAGEKLTEGRVARLNVDMKDDFERFVIEQGYEWVIVDMPASNATFNNICFTQLVKNAIVPLSSDIFSISGYGKLINDVNDARKMVTDAKNQVNIIGVYMSCYNAQRNLHRQLKELTEEGLGEMFIDIQIPYSSDACVSLSEGRPLSFYHAGAYSKCRDAYERLTEYIIQNAAVV